MFEKFFHKTEQGAGYEEAQAQETALLKNAREKISTLEGAKKIMALSVLSFLGATTIGCADNGQNPGEGFKNFGQNFVQALREANNEARASNSERITQSYLYQHDAGISAGAGGSSYTGSGAGVSAENTTTKIETREHLTNDNRNIIDETSFKQKNQEVDIEVKNHNK